MSENLDLTCEESPVSEGPTCPACENGDHEHSSFCEADYKCACFCHEGSKTIIASMKTIINLKPKTLFEFEQALETAKVIDYQIFDKLT